MKSGDKLTERYIAGQTGVSRNTVTRAFNILREHGFLESDERFSTRVARNISNLIHDNINWQRIVSRSNVRESPSYLKQMLQQNNSGDQITMNMLSFNNSEFKNLDFFNEIIQSLTYEDLEATFYVQSAQGLPALREEVSEFLKRHGITAPADNITIFSGFAEAINGVAATLLTSNTTVFHGTYSVAEHWTAFSHKNIHRCRLEADNEGIIAENFKRQLNKNAGRSCIFLLESTLGKMMSRRRLNEIYKICSGEQIAVIELDHLRDVSSVVAPPAPFISTNSDQVIYIGSPGISNEIGIKFAWVISPESLTASIVDSKFNMYWGNTTWEIFCWKMMQNGRYEKYLDEVKEVFSRRNKIINAAFEKYLAPHAEWDQESSLYKHIQLHKNVTLDKDVLEKYDCLAITKGMMAPQGHIFIDIVSDTAYEVVDIIKDIAENYITE